MKAFMSRKKIIFFKIFFYLFNFARLANYVSVQIQRYDDCILELNINNYNYFTFTPESIDKCYLGKFEGSPAGSGDFILLNYEYKFNDKLEFTFGDYDHTEGWMIVDVYFNEYHIKTSDRAFWKCRDCGYYGNTDYEYYNQSYVEWMKETIYTGDRLYFYPQYGNKTKDHLYKYHFDFVINDITDLYKGGVKGAFKVNNAFYSLGSQQTFEIYRHLNSKI